MAEPRKRAVAVIVPAYNEEERIVAVLAAIASARYADEIIVVDDGSTDQTAEVARKIPGIKVIRLNLNIGKGGAMWEGSRHTNAPFLAFVDADLGGLTGEHVDKIIKPIIDDRCDMCIGIFRGGRAFSNAAQRVSPFLSGQRAVRRELFEAVPYLPELRMGVEVALNSTAKRKKAKVLRVILRGVSNYHKEQKLGIVKGAAARLKMYGEITQAVVKTRRRRRRPPNDRWFWPS